MRKKQKAWETVKSLGSYSKSPYFITLTAGIVLAFTPLRIVSMLVILFALSRLLTIGFGFAGRLVVAFVIISCINACIGAFAWMIRLPLSSGELLTSYSIALIVFIALRYNIPYFLPNKKEVFNVNEILAVAITLFFVVVAIRPIVSLAHPVVSAATIAPVLMAGGDNSTHMRIMRMDDLNHGYTLGKSNRYNLPGILIAYPQGWHFNAAILKWTVEPLVGISPSPTGILAFYYGIITLWFGVFVFLLTRTALWLKDSFVGANKIAASYASLIVALVCVIAVSGWLISLFEYGFQTQIAALCLLLLQAVFIAESYSQKALSDRYAKLSIAGLLLAGSGLFYLFLVPVGALLLVTAVIHTWYTTKKLPIIFLILFVLLAALILFQPFIQLTLKTPPMPGIIGGPLNFRGNVVHTSMYPLIGIFIAMSIFTFLQVRQDVRTWVVYMAGFWSLGFALALMVYQTHTVHELRYYYFKSTYTFIVVAVIMVAAMSGLLFERLATPQLKMPNYKWRIGSLVVGTFVIGGMLFSAWKSVSFDNYTHGRLQGISPAQAAAVANLLNKSPENSLYLTSIGSCNRGDDIRTVELASAIAYVHNPDDAPYSPFELSFLSKEYLFHSMKQYIATRHKNLLILSSDQTLAKELIDDLGNEASHVRVINLDPSPQSETSNLCPERIRTLTTEEVRRGIQ